MKIGYVSTVQNYRWAGSEELWWGTAKLAIEAGHSVTCLVHHPLEESEQIRELVVRGASVAVRRRRLHPRLSRLSDLLTGSLKSLLRTHPDKIVISLGSVTDLCFWPGFAEQLMGAGVPYIVVLQFNADTTEFSPIQREQCRALFQRAETCVFVSAHNQRLARRQLALSSLNSEVIYNPIRITQTNPAEFPRGELTFGMVARMETRWKGQDLLLECLASGEWPVRKWSLKFFGAGPDKDFVRQSIQHFGLTDRVEICGYVRDVKDVWGSCHIKVLPSYGEGTPLAVLEAMMCGRPVVTTDVGGNCEILKDGTSGFIADAATVCSFSRALERAWAARDDWKSMGRAAHEAAVRLVDRSPFEALLAVIVKS